MTLEEIESMELTDELIEQARQDPTSEALALAVLVAARTLLDYCDNDVKAAKEQVLQDYASQTPIHGGKALRLLLKAIDVLGDFRAKKAANPHADQSKGLTANDTTGNGCCEHCTTAAGGKQEEE